MAAHAAVLALRRVVYHAAFKADAWKDVRIEASMIKLYGAEMATEIRII